MSSNENLPTLVIGASPKSNRYSNIAIDRLIGYGHTVYALAKRKNNAHGIEIADAPVELENIHTVTIYLRDYRQKDLYDYVLSLKPKRIIFNPGAENKELEDKAKAQGIEVLNACTLVMLSTNQY